MASNTYDLGNLVKSKATFRNPETKAPLDPTTVSVSVKDPSGNVDTYLFGTDAEVVQSAVGVYYINVDADEAGSFYVRWFSTGTGQAGKERRFTVRHAQAVAA